MQTKAVKLFCALLTAAVLSLSVRAQVEAKKSEGPRSPIVRETETNWKRAKKWTLDYVDAMPEANLGFKPAPAVRSFAEQFLHLAFWNFGLLEAAGGKANPYGKKQETLEKSEAGQSKAALRKVVEESYDAVLASMTGLDEAKLLEQVAFFKTRLTRLSVYGLALDHQTHHRGQTTMYLRLKGLTPPPEP